MDSNIDVAALIAERDKLAALVPALKAENSKLIAQDRLIAERDAAEQQLLYWRARYLQNWGERVEGTAAPRANPAIAAENARLRQEEARLMARETELLKEIEALRHTVSWRVTKPLRSVRTVLNPS